MSSPSADLITLSRLLDEILDLEPAQVDSWLAALPAEHAHLRPRLQTMLDAHLAKSQHGFLDDGPRIECGAADGTVSSAGDRIGPYRLIREIGHGGMGTVWLADRDDGSYKRQVALKLPRLAWGAGLAERMARERDIGALLEHPNIARLYDAGVDGLGRPFLALEYIDGQSLDAWCEAKGLSITERLQLFIQVARAVGYAHGRLVVHRDLKPSNVLVTADGQAHLLDFGIAKLLNEAAVDHGLTRQQGRVMTLQYASPEQIAGEAIGVASDIYSLGVLFYEILTGTLPIAPKRATPAALEEAVLEGNAPLASSRAGTKAAAKALRGDVDAILAKAMEREPARRYATADALAQDIERHLDGKTVAAKPDSLGYRMGKNLRRHWLGIGATSAVLAAIVIGSIAAVSQAQRAARSAERERVVKEFVTDVFRVNSQIYPNAALRSDSPQALLEGGAQLIEKRFAGQPELQAELFGVVGSVFSDMGAYKAAADYATRQLDLLERLSAPTAQQARAALFIGEALHHNKDLVDSEKRVRQAIALATDEPAVLLDARLMLVRVSWDQGAPLKEISEDLDRVEAMPELRRPGSAVARAWTGFLRAEQLAAENQLDSSVVAFQNAIDSVVQVEGELSRTAMEMRLKMADWLRATSNSDRGKRQFEDVLSALRQLGGVHQIRALFVAAQAAAQLREDRDLTIHTLISSRAALLSSRMPVPDWWIPQIDYWIGKVELTAGNVTAALGHFNANEAIMRRIGPVEEFLWHFALAEMHSGEHDSADRHFREMRDLRRRMGEGDQPWATDDYVLIATNLVMQGRINEADRVLDELPTRVGTTRGDGWRPDHYARLVALTRANIRLAAGDVEKALLLLRTVTATDEDLLSIRVLHARMLGEALCLTSQEKADGRVLLQSTIDGPLRGVATYSYAPWIARTRAIAGRCALGLGDRREAIRLAALASEAFRDQPNISSYYTKPLKALELVLGKPMRN